MRMWTTLGIGAVALALNLAAASPAFALTISFFANSTFVDMTREGPNMRATLTGLGHTVTDFTGISAADFTAAASADVIVFPEMEIANLNSALTADARAVLSAYVASGGGIVQANFFVSNSSLPNALFGYSLVQSGSIGATTLDAAAAAGTEFAGGPATLPGSNAVEGVANVSLPVGALNIYHDATSSAVFTTSFGAGHFVYLGFDWFEEPTPAEWTEVTRRALLVAAASVPEPSSLALIGLALAGLGFSRRKRAIN